MIEEFTEPTEEADPEGLTQEESVEIESGDPGDEEPSEKPSKTVSDDVRKAIEQLKTEKEAPEGQELEKPQLEEKSEQPKQPGRPKKRIIEQQDLTTIEPPAQLDAKEKQIFNKIPRELKTAYQRVIGNGQAENHRIYQQVQQLHNEYGEIAQAIKPYLNDWGMRGTTPAQAVRQLASVNQYLIQKREDGVVDLIRSMKLDPNLIVQKLSGNGQQQGQQQNNSYQQLNPELTRELEESRMFRQQLLSQAQTQHEQQVHQLGHSIAHEIKSVMDETDGAGFYKYPKLHDDGYRRGLEKLVLIVREEQPSLTWKDAFKVAYQVKEGQTFNGTPRASQTNPQIKQQPRTGSVSVRGRGMINGSAIPKSKKGDSTRDDIRRAIGLVKGNRAY